MKFSSRHIFAAASALAMLGVGTPAVAGGGGGGGGAAPAPSASAERVDPVIAYRQGVQLYRSGEYRKAERILRQAASAARRDANVHKMLGLSQVAQEKWRPAARSLSKAIRYDSEMHDVRAQLGIAYLKRDKTKKAAEQLTELETRMAACGDACAANLVEATAMLRAAMETGGDVSASLPAGPVLASADAADLAYLEAVRLINLEEYDQAIAELSLAAETYGPHPDVLTYLGFTHRKLGNYEQAISFYTSALEVDPAHLSANEYLGEYYVELGDLDAAKGQLAKLESLCAFGCAQVDELNKWIYQAEL